MTKKLKSIFFRSLMILFLVIICTSNIYANELPSLYSKNAILIDNDSGKVLFEKGGNERVYPASTTKVLTAILVLENLDISSSTVVSKTAVDLPYGSSNAALKQGEIMSIEDLLYAMMLKSGNDCANALAEAVSGSIDQFVVLMNEKLNELGCKNSHFTNAHGYHDDNHYTTPSDMMKILSYAIKNEEFVKITSTASYTIQPTNKTLEKREYQNTNRLILSKEDSYLSRYYKYCIGGKTGYTDEAGRTLVVYGTKDGKNLILGVFNSDASGYEDVRYTDAINLFEYGFNNFEKSKLLNKKDYSFSYTDYNSKLVYNYSLSENIFALSDITTTSDITAIGYDIDLDYDKLAQYDINSENYNNQVIGCINIKFRQNSSTYDKSFDLVLTNISRAPIYYNVNTFRAIIVCVLYLLLGILVILFIMSSIKKYNQKKRTKLRSPTANYHSRRKLNK